MRITQEADYALRICTALAQTDAPVGAPRLSEELSIPQSFTSKILRKLMLAGIVKSTRGVNGGFSLNIASEDLSLKQIIESVDGVIAIRHCLLPEHVCSRHPSKPRCKFHLVFEELNSIITSRLEMISIADMVNEDIPVSELIERLHNL